jgi:hypothetical protein
LIEQELIKKPEHGKYQLTEDGKIFFQAIETAYSKSDKWKKSQISMLTRQSSAPFIDALFSQKG